MTNSILLLQNKIAESRDRLYRVALAWCGDQMLAEDLVHESITTGIDKCHQLRNEEQLFSWLYSILNNKWYRHLQKRKNHDDLDDQIACEESGPCTACHELQLVTQVRHAITQLPVVERQVISLVDLEELSYCEVASVLDIPIGTVMSRLHRARKNLLNKIETSKLENYKLDNSIITNLSQKTSMAKNQLHRVK